MRAYEFCDYVAGRFNTHSDFMEMPGGELNGQENGLATSAAVLFAVLDKGDEAHLLLTQRSENLSDHAGEIALPGGKVDEGESFSQAAVREAQEEVGLNPEKVKIIGSFGPYHSRSNYAIVPVVGLLQDDVELCANEQEVTDIFVSPLSFLLDFSNHHRKELNGRIYYSIPWQDDCHVSGKIWNIWGVTAGIIRMVSQRIYGDKNAR